MTSKPRWVENGVLLQYRIERAGVEVIISPENDEKYSISIRGKNGSFPLRTTRGMLALYSLEIAKFVGEKLARHGGYVARASGRSEGFELCPQCDYIQKVNIDVNTGAMQCVICKKIFKLPEPAVV